MHSGFLFHLFNFFFVAREKSPHIAKNNSKKNFLRRGLLCQQSGAAVSAVFQPGRIEGTEIIRRLLQHPECQGQVD